MSEQYALPTLVQQTAIVGVRNLYDYPDTDWNYKRLLNEVWIYLKNKARMLMNFVTHLVYGNFKKQSLSDIKFHLMAFFSSVWAHIGAQHKLSLFLISHTHFDSYVIFTRWM